MVEAPGTAPGSSPLITKPFIAVVRPKPNNANIGTGRGDLKGAAVTGLCKALDRIFFVATIK